MDPVLRQLAPGGRPFSACFGFSPKTVGKAASGEDQVFGDIPVPGAVTSALVHGQLRAARADAWILRGCAVPDTAVVGRGHAH